MLRKSLAAVALLAAPAAFYGQYGSGSQFAGVYQVSNYPGASLDAKLNACVNSMGPMGGICDARSFGASTLAANITVTAANVHVLLPCATITTAYQFIVAAGVRNTYLEGCAYQGGSAASGTQGGTVWVYTGSVAAFSVGDSTYAVDTKGFRISNVNLNTASAGTSAQGLTFYRTQEIDARNLYLNGNQLAGQTGIYLDGTGNYAGGTFDSNTIDGFGTAVYMTGHQTGSAVDDYSNASAFTRLHVDCPTSGGSPISGTYGINLLGGDGNTWSGGDIESCSTMFHFGANATSNTVDGLRNENSTIQYQADSGSTYNAVFTGGTFFTGKLVDNGSRNSFWDAFHRTVNGMNGDWYASQQDATVTDHQRLGTGLGNERGRSTEYQTDYGYRWQIGLGDGTTGLQVYSIQDLIAGVQRLSIGQYLSSAANTVTDVVVNNGGCYTSSTPPTVSFSGGGGSGAAGTAVMYLILSTSLSCPGGYGVASVTMTNNGSGYTSQPTVGWAGSNQTTAPTAIAEITTAGSTNNQTALNSSGTGAVVLNGSANSGTGGTAFGSGGATPTTVGTIDASGNQTLYGYLRFFASAAEQFALNCASASACNIDDWSTGSAVHRIRIYSGAGLDLDSAGTAAVTVNNTSGSGAGGFIVYEGGSNSSTAALTVTPSGTFSSASNGQVGLGSGTGSLAIGNRLNQIAANDYAGSCTISSGSCTVSLQHSYTSTPLCFVTIQGSTAGYAACSVSSNVATVTAGAGTFAVLVIGNPN